MSNLDEGNFSTSDLDEYKIITTADIVINTTVRASNRKEALRIASEALLNDWLSQLPIEDSQFEKGTVNRVNIRISHGT